jgi:putative AlgH/UPF0301 family transcriptional regulator
MIKNRVTRSLYRSLIKIARNFDNAPAAKTLLYRTDLYNMNKTPAANYYTNILGKLFEKDSFLLKPKDDNISFVELIREESRAINPEVSSSDRLDAGFAAMRKLSSLWGIYNDNEDDDELDCDEIVPEIILNSDVTLSTSLASGVLLLAHPMLQGPLHRSVILLLEHNSKGSYGVVINNMTGHSVKSSIKNLPENIINTFGYNSVAFGGMVRRLTYLHDVPQVGGISIPTCKRPLFAGGEVSKALAFVKEEKAKEKAAAVAAINDPLNPDTVDNTSGESDRETMKTVNPAAERFRFFVGCCLWEGGNLEKELKSGYWIPTHSEPDTVLDLAMLSPNMQEDSEHSDDDSEEHEKRSGRQKRPPVTRRKDSKDSIIEGESSEVAEEESAVGMTASNPVSESVVGGPEAVKASVEELDQMLDKMFEAGTNGGYNDNDDERYSVDVWKALLRTLGEPYADMADLPGWVSAKDVESADWK